jgi:glycosyltransferase involved in cell wall biosynthesis
VRDDGAPVLVRTKNRIDKWRSRRDEAAIVRRARVVIANSDKTRRDLESLVRVDPERIHVVPLGCDPDADAPQDARVIAERRRELGVGPRELFVVFIGALGHDRNKGLDTLLDAWAFLKRDRYVTGRVFAIGAAVPRWRAEIAARGLEADVTLLGSRDDAGDILAAADLLVAPSRYDSYGLAVQEALCRHVPAITSSGSGVSERYPPSLARLVLPDPDDARALAERIAWCARDRESAAPEIPREIARLGDEIRTHTWARMSEEIARCVESTVPPRDVR